MPHCAVENSHNVRIRASMQQEKRCKKSVNSPDGIGADSRGLSHIALTSFDIDATAARESRRRDCMRRAEAATLSKR
jgi:hypothetical protein